MPEYTNTKLRTPPHPPTAIDVPRQDYAELDVTTNFSVLPGASHPEELVYRAAELGYRAIAITDRNSLAGIVRAHTAARQLNPPPKLIIGSRLTFSDAPDLLVWVTNRDAYARLCRLLTLGRQRNENGESSLHLADFLQHHTGLLAAVSTPSADSFQNQLPQIQNLRDALSHRLSLAVSRLHNLNDHSRLSKLANLGQHYGIPLLATNNVHYHSPHRRMLQDVLTCIRHTCTIHQAGYRLFPNAERYLKSPAQMHRLFADYPHAIRQAIEIAQQCSFSLDQLKYEYPHQLVPPHKSAIQHLADLAWNGAADRYPQGIPDKVRQLIHHELALIQKLQYEPYFLTVHDLVQFARNRGILCQGRGSAANSAVCYCIGITSVDPARIDLLFERFLSAARNEPPDIDVDFEHERREEVIQYIYQKYGRDHAGITAEVISYRPRSAVRDVGKALGLGLDLVDQIAKKIDWWHRGALNHDQLRQLALNPNHPTIRLLVNLTNQLLGFPRHLSQHVGGMVITRSPLCELVPIQNASMPNRTIIQWDKDDIDALGILKIDLLALGILTCISKTLTLINNHTTPANQHPSPHMHSTTISSSATIPPSSPPQINHLPLQLHTVPPEDPAVYDMISNADTVGVFQIESRAQMSMLPRLRPRCFYDLVIQVAIVRPGPIQGKMVHPYLRRRNGEEDVTYPSNPLREVLQKTLGVPLFQEQAMRIAIVGAGFSPEDADRLRRAMAAWRKHDAIDQFQHKFITGMLHNGYSPHFAQQCFLQIRGFGEYGFPESHAASFALLVYVSAWLKRHFPAHFAAALLNSQPMGFYAPAQIVRDAQSHGVTILPPDINHSLWDCTLEPAAHAPTHPHAPSTYPKTYPAPPHYAQSHYAVRLGFRLIKGLQIAHANQLITARNYHGPFTSIPQFHHLTALPHHVLQRLAEADAFASLNLPRRQTLWQVLALSNNQIPLFHAQQIKNQTSNTENHLPPMPLGQEVLSDYRSTSLSLKQHPISLVRNHLSTLQIIPASHIQHLRNGQITKTAGLVLVRQRPATASGIVFITLEDETGIVNLIIRPNIYHHYHAAAQHAALLQADGYIERQGNVIHLVALRLTDLSHLLTDCQFSSRDFH